MTNYDYAPKEESGQGSSAQFFVSARYINWAGFVEQLYSTDAEYTLTPNQICIQCKSQYNLAVRLHHNLWNEWQSFGMLQRGLGMLPLPKYIRDHFIVHGITKKSRDVVIPCQWEGCSAELARYNFVRHIREKTPRESAVHPSEKERRQRTFSA
ncbi:hypothetical protein F5J12DRAFT_925630 [Pisolithus orientalis]|uniref:uncharacterized protein n=1 Tax=Pisolithus orientalis TaxID=936130 RepID=UPI00222422B2|nr:uncharacterized protein F5J12DRAFT_925630 [Pisolithus orientalis]KAI6025745.1 hypothetical protein F5J12DRAFT_925630 [Pisolithus orientalis]